MTTNTNLPDDVNLILKKVPAKPGTLHKAISNLQQDIIEQLSDDLSVLNSVNCLGDTPLIHACKQISTRALPICRTLLEKGVAIYATNQAGHDAFAIAAARNEPQLLEMLLEKVERENRFDYSFAESIEKAIKIAGKYKHFSVISSLLKAECFLDNSRDFQSTITLIVNTIKEDGTTEANKLYGDLEPLSDIYDLSGEKDLSLVKEAPDYPVRLSI